MSSSTLPLVRVAVVTGAAQGIGYSIAIRLAEDGIDVAVNDVSAKVNRLEEVAEELRAKGRRCIVAPGDVSKERDVQHIVDETVRLLGGVDIVSQTNRNFRGRRSKYSR